ncbi:MAG: 5'-3' exonuclease H3TH domain-containing protein, partial [Bacteroidota bacterium]|nr:5'-3' exonuclease H3TH domain-containing protein [Bacteroidota bacterium]
MSEQKRLFLLDAYALIFRGYYALIKNPRINSKGMDTSAIMGFMNSLLDVIKREQPDHLAVAFDKGGSVERTELFEDYKANRDETPDAIRIAVPYIQQILKAMKIPVVELAGYEADDLIGTLAKQAEQEGYKVFMVTPDKDFGQLVSENIFMYRPARMGNGIEIWGIPEVQKRFGVQRPEQVIDYLGMMGDASDNIPGLPGVGDKTAKKFLEDFGSLEGLLSNTDKLSGKMKEKIEENAELGRLSRKLAEIKTDCEVQFHAEDYEMCPPDAEEVQKIFEELEFRRLKEQFLKLFSGEAEPGTPVTSTETAKQEAKVAGSGQFTLFGGDPSEAAATIKDVNSRKTIADVPHFYQSVQGGMAMELFLQNLMKQSSVCFDTETTSINPLEAELVGIAFSWAAGKGFYVPFPEGKNDAMPLIEKLRPFFESEKIEKIGQNLKYDIKVMQNYDVDVKGELVDT